MEIMVFLGLSVLIGVIAVPIAWVAGYLMSISIIKIDFDEVIGDCAKGRVRMSPKHTSIEYFDECGSLIGSCIDGDKMQRAFTSMCYSIRYSRPGEFNVYRRAWGFTLFGFMFCRFKHYESASMVWGSICEPPVMEKAP